MFSQKLLIFIGIVLFIAINFIVITMSSKESLPVNGIERLSISIISPVQQSVTNLINFAQDIWNTYFMTILTLKENIKLKKQLGDTIKSKNHYEEMELENSRLKQFVYFTGSVSDVYIAARIIARDPSPWFKTIMIDKGTGDGILKGSPVIVSEGIVGQTIKVAKDYSKVILLIDRNSAVDALIQNTRIRGIVKGDNKSDCSFEYTLKKDEVKQGEIIISSGLDQVFPKGLRIGRVLKVSKISDQLFQNITIETSVNFDKIEEVLVLKKE